MCLFLPSRSIQQIHRVEGMCRCADSFGSSGSMILALLLLAESLLCTPLCTHCSIFRIPPPVLSTACISLASVSLTCMYCLFAQWLVHIQML